jgi:hypothetical protein
MANKKSERDIENSKASWEGKPRPGQEPNGGFRGFINLDLSDEQKAAFPAWFDSQDFGETLSYHAFSGVVLSVKKDAKGGGFMASATQKDVGNVNSGLAVTARAANALTAMERLVYILALLGDDWEETQPRAQGDRW